MGGPQTREARASSSQFAIVSPFEDTLALRTETESRRSPLPSLLDPFVLSDGRKNSDWSATHSESLGSHPEYRGLGLPHRSPRANGADRPERRRASVPAALGCDCRSTHRPKPVLHPNGPPTVAPYTSDRKTPSTAPHPSHSGATYAPVACEPDLPARHSRHARSWSAC